MLTGVGDSVIFGRTTLLAQLSDSNEETTNIDDSFDGGIAEGELYEVSSSCSDAVNSSASDDNGD